MRYSNQANNTQQTASAAQQLQQPSIRCTFVPKGSVINFSYQPKRSIAIG